MTVTGEVAAQLLDSPVDGWKPGASANVPGQTQFYNNVLANACRVCHTAQPFEQLQFKSSDKFLDVSTVAANNRLMLGTAQMRVCGDYTMPHAFRTHEIFWGTYTDPTTAPISMPTEFQNFGDNPSVNGGKGYLEAGSMHHVHLGPGATAKPVLSTDHSTDLEWQMRSLPYLSRRGGTVRALDRGRFVWRAGPGQGGAGRRQQFRRSPVAAHHRCRPRSKDAPKLCGTPDPARPRPGAVPNPIGHR